MPKDASFFDLPVIHAKLLPSFVQAPKLEKKTLPSDLKHVFQGGNETIQVIVSNKLSVLQEEKLVQVLKKHKTATKKVESTNDEEIQSLATSKLSKVNGHQHKPFYEGLQVETVENLELIEPNPNKTSVEPTNLDKCAL